MQVVWYCLCYVNELGTYNTSLSYTLSYSFTALFVNEMINSDI